MIGSTGDDGSVFVLGQHNLSAYIATEYNGTGAAFQSALYDAYKPAVPTLDSEFYAISQLYTDNQNTCTTSLLANQSAAAGLGTWRYYFNASFPNENPNAALATIGAEGLDLYALHTSEIAFVFGNLPVGNTTAEEYALGRYVQDAWARFAKDPKAGPGWASYRDGDTNRVNRVGVAALGVGGGSSSRVAVIPASVVDKRCNLWREYLLNPLL